MDWRLKGIFAVGVSLAIASATLAAAEDLTSLMGADPREAPDAQSVQRDSAVYAARCASCHDGGVGRAPARFILSMIPARAVQRALTDGVMRPMAAGLSDEDKRSVSEFLAQKRMGAAPSPPLMCADGASPFAYSEPPPLGGWGLGRGNAHAVSPALAGLDFTRATPPKLQWAVAFPDAIRARSQPTLGGGAIFVGSHDGTVFALDRQTGCARWVFHASAEVRTGVTLTPWTPGDGKAKPLALFGDLVGNVYALDAVTGRQVWKVKADSHANATITGTPAIFENKLLVPVSSLEEASAADPRYACCTFRGSLIAYDVRTGNKLWQAYMVDTPKPAGAGSAGAPKFGPSGIAIWSAPTTDPKHRRVYVTTGDNYSSPATALSDAIVALDVDTGHIVWSHQVTDHDAWTTGCMLHGKPNCPEEDGPDYDFGAAPILTQGSDGKAYLLAGQKSGIVYGLDPVTGKLRWKTKVGRGGASGGVHFGMSAQDGRLFVPVTDMGEGGPGTGPAKPGLNALDIATGRILWRFQSGVCQGKPRCANDGFGSVPTAVGRQVLVGGNDGRLRALDVKTGAVVWEYDTNQTVVTVNGVSAHGGAMAGGHGPIAYKGMVYMPSGYGFAGQAPGNVLLAFRGG